MKRWTPWTVALTAAGIAAVLVLWRYMDVRERALRLQMTRITGEAMVLLVEDPLAMRQETQRAVRLVAAAADAGHINTPEARYALALQLQREDRSEDAERLLREIIAEQPDWSWPYAQLGSLLGRGGPERLAEAEQLLREAIYLEPEWSRPYNSLAVTLRLMGRYDESEGAALRALELAPGDIAAHNNYANLMVTLGRYEEAEEHYFYAAHLEPENPKPLYNLACLYSVMERIDDALEFLEVAIALSDAIRRDAAMDPYFDNLRHLPRFEQMVYGATPFIEESAADDVPTSVEEDEP